MNLITLFWLAFFVGGGALCGRYYGGTTGVVFGATAGFALHECVGTLGRWRRFSRQACDRGAKADWVIELRGEKSSFETIDSWRRAMVFLTVPWSGPERTARRVFQEATVKLAPMTELGIAYSTLDEDSDATHEWLASLDVAHFASGIPKGAGSVLWLENGKLVAADVSAAHLTSDDLVARTLRMWGQSKDS